MGKNKIVNVLSICASCLIILCNAAPAVANDPSKLAIVDASVNTADYLDALQASGIRVIGRYYARCKQPEIAGLEEKRLVDNGGSAPGQAEIDKILAHSANFGVLSIYQYYSNSELKYIGKGKLGNRVIVLKDRDCREPANPPHTAEEEAKLDADAALNQAEKEPVKQPAGTAIYFGVDFDFDDRDAGLAKRMLTYFKVISEKVRSKGYLVGAYGNGAALALLMNEERIGEVMNERRKYIDLAWLNPSRGHRGAVEFFNGGQWDIFQTRIALRFVSTRGKWLEVDTDVQNAKDPNKYIGFWRREGVYKVEEQRTKEIYAQRRFSCDGISLIRTAPGGLLASGVFCGRRTDAGRAIKDCDEVLSDQTGRPVFDASYPRADERSRVCFGDVLRIVRTEGTFAEIDCDEDGKPDGWTDLRNLGASFETRPAWVPKRKDRRATRRGATNCKQPADDRN
jgi:hypothetical protein